MALRNGSLSFADMKTATPFFSDFFNTDCLVVEGVPHFSITGATKTLYGNTGGKSLKLLTDSLLRSGHQNPVAAVDLSDFPGIGPVTIEADGTKTGRVRDALAMNQDTFKSLLKHLLKTATPQTPVAAGDLDSLPGIVPVLIDNGHMKQKGQAMTQDTFKSPLPQ